MQNGSNPKGKYLIIILQTIKWWEISCDSFLAETLMSVVGRGKTEEVMAGWQPVFISWLLVAHQWPEVWGSTSNPYITGVISTITARLTAARPLHWMYIIAHKHQPRRDTLRKKKRHTTNSHAYADAYLCTRHSHTDLLDWQWFVRFSWIYLCTPSECTSQFSSKLKALICHPVQSKFNASNYRGSASRQIWSEEAWQESLLRIRAF